MDVFRLRPNALKTPTGGGFYGTGSMKQRKSLRRRSTNPGGGGPNSSEYSPNSSYSTQLLIPDVAPSPALDDISINSADLRNLLWNEGNRRPSTYELLKQQQQQQLPVATLPMPGTDAPGDILNASFILPKIGFDPRAGRRPPTRELTTQTRKRILLREYLPTVKDHKVWRQEKCDPFLEDIKNALLKNKPESMEEFVMAFCEARLAGNPEPETHKGHSGGDGNSHGHARPLIRVQAAAVPRTGTAGSDIDAAGAGADAGAGRYDIVQGGIGGGGPSTAPHHHHNLVKPPSSPMGSMFDDSRGVSRE